MLDFKFEPHPTHWFWTTPLTGVINVEGAYVWSNLKEWLRLWHSGSTAQRLNLGQVAEDDWYVVVGRLCDIVGEMEDAGVGWDVTERILEMYRQGVEANTGGWKFG